MRTLLQKRLARGRVELGISVQVRDTQRADRGVERGVRQALSAAIEQARGAGLVSGTLSPGDLLRLPQAITVRERVRRSRSRASKRARGEHRGRGRAGAGRSGCDARARGRRTCATDLDARRQTLADLIERLRVAADEGRGALETPAARAHRRDAAGAAGRSGDDRAGDRARRRALRHQRGGDAVPRRTWRTGGRWPTATSRAGASSTSCCRR